jgi:hypothetical protein
MPSTCVPPAHQTECMVCMARVCRRVNQQAVGKAHACMQRYGTLTHIAHVRHVGAQQQLARLGPVFHLHAQARQSRWRAPRTLVQLGADVCETRVRYEQRRQRAARGARERTHL